MTNNQVAQELIEIFNQQGPELLTNMVSGFEAGDHEALIYASHTLKSSGLNVGAESLAEKCNTIESILTRKETKRMKDIGPLIEGCQRDMSSVLQELQVFKTQIS